MTHATRCRRNARASRALLLALALLLSLGSSGCSVTRLVWRPRPAGVPKTAEAAPARKAKKPAPARPRRVAGAGAALASAGPSTARTGDPKLADAREQAALSPAEPYWLYREAELLFAADSSAAAERALRSALARDPDYAPALSRLSRLDWEHRRHADAVARLEASRARRGTLAPELAAGLALHYDALDRPEEARAALAQGSAAESRGTASVRVYVTLRGEHPESAAELAVAALGDEPRSAVAQNNYGIARLRAGDPASAKKAFRRAIELDPRLPGPHYNLAILEKFYLLDDDAAERAIQDYWRRAQDDPDSLRQAFESPARRELARGGN
jgi:tetratricopeptide (TPR) repeat protein